MTDETKKSVKRASRKGMVAVSAASLAAASVCALDEVLKTWGNPPMSVALSSSLTILLTPLFSALLPDSMEVPSV